MKFISFQRNGAIHIGVLDGQHVVEINDPKVPGELAAALMAGIDLRAVAKAALGEKAPRLKLADLDLAPAVPRPPKVLCIGLNYFSHAKEAGVEKPAYPMVFMRGPSSLVAHGKPAIRPRVSTSFDFEAELAVVIGKSMRHANASNALDCVFGYSCFNDMSLRDYQRKTSQYTMGKNFDATGGFGPCVVTADELPAGAGGLQIQGRLNGAVMQSSNTSDMIWGVADIIVLMTECMTLEPGDVIIMGTPGGVGAARKPPVWMKHGDTFEVEIEGIGLLSNPVQDEAA